MPRMCRPGTVDRGRDGQEDLGHRQDHHLATYENGRPGDDESGNRSRGS